MTTIIILTMHCTPKSLLAVISDSPSVLSGVGGVPSSVPTLPVSVDLISSLLFLPSDKLIMVSYTGPPGLMHTSARNVRLYNIIIGGIATTTIIKITIIVRTIPSDNPTVEI